MRSKRPAQRTQNLYTYTGNNLGCIDDQSINYIDPTGHMRVDFDVQIVGSVVPSISEIIEAFIQLFQSIAIETIDNIEPNAINEESVYDNLNINTEGNGNVYLGEKIGGYC